MTLSIQHYWVYQLAILCFWLQAKVRSSSSYEINTHYNMCKNYLTDFLSDAITSDLQTFQDQHLCLKVSCYTVTLTHFRTEVSLITLQTPIGGTYKVWKVFTFSSDHWYSTSEKSKLSNYFSILIQLCGHWHTLGITLLLHLVSSNILQQRQKHKLTSQSYAIWHHAN